MTQNIPFSTTETGNSSWKYGTIIYPHYISDNTYFDVSVMPLVKTGFASCEKYNRRSFSDKNTPHSTFPVCVGIEEIYEA